MKCLNVPVCPGTYVVAQSEPHMSCINRIDSIKLNCFTDCQEAHIIHTADWSQSSVDVLNRFFRPIASHRLPSEYGRGMWLTATNQVAFTIALCREIIVAGFWFHVDSHGLVYVRKEIFNHSLTF